MMRRIAAIVAGLLAVAAASPAAPAAEPHPLASGAFAYTVRQGDTTWTKIAQRFCATIDATTGAKFSRAATGSGNGVVHVGQEIFVNLANCPATPAPSTTSTSSTTSTTLPPTTTTTPSNQPLQLSDGRSAIVSGGPIPPPTQDGEGNARITCGFSHLAYDDAIVAPGVPGAAHLHMFWGNTGADAFSTYESLRSSGQGTCDGGTANLSAYWAPAVLDPAGKARIPDSIAVYYKSFAETSRTVPPPAGLKMIAGYDMAKPADQKRHHAWFCGGEDAGSQGTAQIRNCPTGELVAEILFPECWDGVNLDSADHRAHLAYAADLPGGVCGASHPVRIPEVTYRLIWTGAQQASTWKLSSDTMPGMTHVNGTTLHGDWLGAWEPWVLQTMITNCVVGRRDCQSGALGDGRALRSYGFTNGRYDAYKGPWTITTPTRA